MARTRASQVSPVRSAGPDRELPGQIAEVLAGGRPVDSHGGGLRSLEKDVGRTDGGTITDDLVVQGLEVLSSRRRGVLRQVALDGLGKRGLANDQLESSLGDVRIGENLLQ